jgi:hypothetical protein
LIYKIYIEKKSGKKIISCEDLYRIYKNFCDETGIVKKIKSKIQFSTSVNKLDIFTKKRTKDRIVFEINIDFNSVENCMENEETRKSTINDFVKQE